MTITVGEHFNPDNPNMLVANVGVEIAGGVGSGLTSPIFIAVSETQDVTGSFTTATATTSVTNPNIDGYPTALISINGTYGTASAVFEVSDDGGTTWFSVLATRSDGTATETGYTGLTNTTRQWVVPVSGNDSIRVRSTAVASGTVNVRIGATGAATNQATSNTAPTGLNVAVTPTIQAAQYVSGNNMGGLQTVTLGTTQSLLSQVSLMSQGGLATGKVIYLFDANPTGSTFTDKSTFTLATADTSKILAIFTLTPVAPTGTTRSYAAASNLALAVPAGGVIYMAIVETATETPGSTSDLVFNFSAV